MTLVLKEKPLYKGKLYKILFLIFREFMCHYKTSNPFLIYRQKIYRPTTQRYKAPPIQSQSQIRHKS